MPKDEFTPEQYEAAREDWLARYANIPGPRSVWTAADNKRLQDGAHYDRDVPLELSERPPERRTSGAFAPVEPAPEVPELRPAEVLNREWLAVEDLSARTNLGRYARSLQERGWDVKVGRSTYYSSDKYYESSKRVKTGATKQHLWLDSYHDRFGLLTVNVDGAMLNGRKIDKEEWEELWSM